MCRHVVAAFEGVAVEGLVFWHEMVEDGRQVMTDIGVGILVDAYAATGVFHKQVKQT